MATILDITDFVYQTGTLTVAPGDTTAVFTGASLTLAVKDGDELCAGGARAPIKTVTDDGHVELFTPWLGAAVTNGVYIILKSSLLRYHTALIGFDSASIAAKLDGLPIIYDVPNAEPDVGIGEDGNFALKANDGSWKLWLKDGGVWVLQGTPVGANPKGAWNDTDTFLTNDEVQRLGSLYIAKRPNTNAPPESSPDDWDLRVAKGDKGDTGNTGPAPLKPIEVWTTGVAYVVGPPASFVSQGGSAYECLIAHTAGTFATDLAAGKWGLVAAKGQDGTGTGDMQGPSSSTDGGLVVFDGTTGKLVKDSGRQISDFARATTVGANLNTSIAGYGSTDTDAVINAATTLTANLTIPANVRLSVAKGGSITQTGAFTLTINGPFNAGLYKIFTGFSSGQITFASEIAPKGLPEWWGAIVNSSGTDNSPFINSSIVACPETQLQASKYYTANPILIQLNGRALLGSPLSFPGTDPATQIIMTSATATKIQIGPNSWTSGPFQNTAHVRDIGFARSVAPNIASVANGIKVQYTDWPTLNHLLVTDDIVGVHMIGLGQARVNRVFASRRTAGAGGGTDQFYGFWLDAATDIGFAGGSASTYMTECAASSSVTFVSGMDYQGLLANGTFGYSDIYINRFETSNMGSGMTFAGNNNSGGTIDNKNTDVQIYNVILDACHQAGINFIQTSLYGSISVMGGFISTQGDANGMVFNSSLSAIHISGVNTLMGFASGTGGAAVVTSNSKNITMIGNSVTDPKSDSGAYHIESTSDSRFEDRITCNSLTNGGAAIAVRSSSTRNYFGMSVQGKAGAFSVGYYNPDTTTTHTEFNGTGLDPSACTAGKLFYNTAAVTAFGVFGTANLASGVMS